MSKGDKLFGIKTIYKGIEMRSKLETKVALFLDALKIKWEYEPKQFILSDGTPYIPDFHLPDHKIWIEVKGLIKDHNKKISEKFVEENKFTLLLWSSDELIWYGLWNDEEQSVFHDYHVLIGLCSKCKRYFFASNLGSYNCSACGMYDGDHDIIGSINANGWSDSEIDFSNIDSIKRGLMMYGISI